MKRALSILLLIIGLAGCGTLPPLSPYDYGVVEPPAGVNPADLGQVKICDQNGLNCYWTYSAAALPQQSRAPQFVWGTCTQYIGNIPMYKKYGWVPEGSPETIRCPLTTYPNAGVLVDRRGHIRIITSGGVTVVWPH